MLVKSLLDIKGFDNQSRFMLLLIVAVCWLSFISSGNLHWVAVALVTSVTNVVVLLSGLRRANDAGFNVALGAGPGLLLLVVSTISSSAATAELLMMLAWLNALILLLKPSAKQRQYQLGYAGEADLSSLFQTPVKQQLRQRIEPSLAGESTDQSEVVIKNEGFHMSTVFIALDRALSMVNPLMKWSWIVVVIACSLHITTLWQLNQQDIVQQQAVEQQAQEIVEDEFSANEQPQQPEWITIVDLPDDYKIALDSNKSLAVMWEADTVKDGLRWSLLTAKGDKSCQTIQFGKQNFRPVQVFVEGGENYIAQFSPLDTKAMVNAVAKGNQFKLCGYEFSLSGTMKALQYDPYLADYL